MDREQVIAVIRAHETELREAGVLSASLFGSVARGERAPHDVDLAVQLSDAFCTRGLDYFSRLDKLEQRFSEIIGCDVDVVEEPVRHQRLQGDIERDRVRAF